MSQRDARDLVAGQMLPAFKAQRTAANHIDRWWRWDHERPHSPRVSTAEYRELSDRAQTPWLRLVVGAVVQALYVEGYRQSRGLDDAAAWDIWQANGMDRRQVAVHEAAVAYGRAYVTVLPGETALGDPMPVMRGVSPRQMVTFWADEGEDDWPMLALRGKPASIDGNMGWDLRLYDDTDIHYLQASADGDKVVWIESRTHDVGVCPVVRFANNLDLEGRADGEVEPFISVAARIDQTAFDRLVVQRFASWVVRTIAGMSAPERLPAEEQEAYIERTKVRLRVEDILVADDPDTKFGSLPATPLNGFIDAHAADVRDLAAVSQTPPHHLLGQMANLSAEALAAAEASLSRKVEQRKHTLGESWEQTLRLASLVNGDMAGARDMDAQVRWRDMESRSLAQMLGVPAQALWERVPGVTQQDIEHWKALAAQGGSLEQLMAQLAGGQASAGGGSGANG